MSSFRNHNLFRIHSVRQQIIIVLLFNTLIALFLHIIIRDSVFFNQITLSQSIGVSIFSIYLLLAHFIDLKNWRLLIPVFAGTPIGVAIGIAIQAMFYGISFDLVISSLTSHYANILTALFIGLFFGSIALVFFVYRERIHKTRTTLQSEMIKNLDNEKAIAETRLRMLQAQIEPHFLFNTLSNVISLIDIAPEKSKKLLESLTDFLRASLKRSAEVDYSLIRETELVSHYLDIIKLRLGKRLNYALHIQDDIHDCRLPPLLLQPLVENAVKHGIEPLAEGGLIDITISRTDSRLVIAVSDNGKGLSVESSNGFGLTNIRDRIRSFYKGEGHLKIMENQSGGVTATIQIPYEPI